MRTSNPAPVHTGTLRRTHCEEPAVRKWCSEIVNRARVSANQGSRFPAITTACPLVPQASLATDVSLPQTLCSRHAMKSLSSSSCDLRQIRRHVSVAMLWMLLVSTTQVLPGKSTAADTPGAPPNIVVLVSDDAGYADFSFQGSRQIATPHLDAIRRGGVLCQAGYVTASVCSPSRAGLLSGRYQQRFGHEFNIPPKYSETNGLPLSEVLLPAVLQKLNYRTIGLGKWHLGYAPKFHPLNRGFDDFYGFLQGARSYFPLAPPTRLNRLLTNRQPAPEQFDYLTQELGTRAAAYITNHAQQPFFLYVSFNAVHTPMQATPALLERVPKEISDPRRRKLVAMTLGLDDAIGAVTAALRKHKLEQNTLLFFVNDNGGARTNASSNQPLRGRKGSPFEGGIRVPFLVRWPQRIPADSTYTMPVSTLDIFATAITAAGHEGQTPNPLDGVNLTPFLSGDKKGRPHQRLYWRKGNNLAIRDGDWKLLHYRGGPPRLFNLATDQSEQAELSSRHPERVAELSAHLNEWNQSLIAPRWQGLRNRRNKSRN